MENKKATPFLQTLIWIPLIISPLIEQYHVLVKNIIYSARNLDLGPDSLFPFSCILSDVVKASQLSEFAQISKELKSHS